MREREKQRETERERDRERQREREIYKVTEGDWVGRVVIKKGGG